MTKKHEQIIETPDITVAKYVYEDHAGNPVYFDGVSYWVVIDGIIEYYS
jgi:hypothetical protein